MGLYDKLMSKSLELPFLRTYYGTPDAYLDKVGPSHFHLEAEQLAQAKREGLVAVVGEEAVRRFATTTIRRHALAALLMTFVCTLPQNWVVWPLMVVDIVFFQRQVFALTQKLRILYARPDGEMARLSFDYSSLAQAASRMAGTTAAQQAAKLAKQGGSVGLRQALKLGSKLGVRSLRVLVAQAFKWCGIMASRQTIELTITVAVVTLCALIAGLVSYWLMIPMGRRLERELVEHLHAEPNEVAAINEANVNKKS